MFRSRGRRIVAGPRRCLRRSGYPAACALVVGLLVAALVDDVQVQVRLHDSNSQVATNRALTRHTADLISGATAALRRTDHGRRVAETGLTRVMTELATARQLLTQDEHGVASESIELAAVRSCADGVSRSVTALQGGHQAQAVATLSAVASACENGLGSEAGGPVYPFDFADPDVIVVKNTYFAYGTNSTAGNIQIMESTDLHHWTKAGDALPTLASWAVPDETWAPAVIHLKRSYDLYYTAAEAGSKVQCLSVATSKRPQGPFVDATTAPIECQPALGGSIDPSPVIDAAGRPNLVWRSIGRGDQPATLWAQALDPAGTALLAGAPSSLLRPTESWEGSVVEAPTMVLENGTYLLFYSGNNWNSSDYGIGVARCSSVLGPCVNALSGPLFASQSNLLGPGGESVFTDTQGQLQMAFHAWLPGAVGYPHPRLLFVRPLMMDGGLPRVGPPA
jgi:hypothetical protein